MNNLIKQASGNRISALFTSFGSNEYIGEAVTIATHGLQTAYAAKQAGESDEVQIAGLMHDIGHLLALEAGQEMEMEDENGEGTGTMDHDIIGGDFLEKLGFSKNVSFVAKRHVDAKRYLCAREPDYYSALSPASKTTLSYQNGPMTEEECKEFERSESYEFAARVRKYDDAAKTFGLEIPALDAYVPMIAKHLEKNLGKVENSSILSPYAHSYVLSIPQLHQWDKNGMLHIPDAFDDQVEAANNLQIWADEIAEWAIANDNNENNNNNNNSNSNFNQSGTNFPWLKHFEAVGGNEATLKLARVENFSTRHAHWGNLTFGLVNDLISQVYREKAVLFKDKLNFKMPGGAGFLCHQDATAYATGALATHHISAMVAIDEATVENGCLEVAPALHKKGVLKNKEGVTCESLTSEMNFVNVLTQPGDIVLFDSYLPHQSGPNMTDHPRRLAYLTYNKEREGNFHAEYYATKLAHMGSGQMSLNNDFAGKLV